MSIELVFFFHIKYVIKKGNLMNEEKLKRAFHNGLGIQSDTDFESLEYAKSKEWDSVAHMQLIAAIEDEFDIMIDTDDVIAMSSYPVAKQILSKYEVSFA